MLTAVDSSVILDVVCADPRHAESSARALRSAAAEGSLVVCECVIAEIRPAFDRRQFARFLSDWQLRFVPSSEGSAVLAGELFAVYVRRGGLSRALVPDFLIGAHAVLHANRLLARDRGFLRDYFHSLTVINPSLEH